MTIQRGSFILLLWIAGSTQLIFAEPDANDPHHDITHTLFYNGTVLALDEANTQAQAIVIEDNKILDIGSNSLRKRYPKAKLVDLQGQTIMPGFIDTHVHISGKARRYIDLTKVTSIAEIQDLIRAKASQLPAGDWITGYGWSEDTLLELRRPLIADLDAAAPDNPIMLTRAGAHSAVFSSEALRLAGINAQTPDPEGGTIERDDKGALNGIIRERHEELVGKLVPQATYDELRPSLVQELQNLFPLGITSIVEASTSVDYYPEWQHIYATHRGRLPRTAVQLAYAGDEKMSAFGQKSGDGDAHLRVGAIKIFADGGFTGPAAYTTKPYRGEDEYRGKLNMTEGDLRDLIRNVHQQGWQMGIHAIGDAAIELVVDYLSEALADMPREDHRHYLNHFTIKPSTQTMENMAANGIAITQQPNFMYTLEGRYTEYLDGQRLQSNNPMASPMGHGIHVAMSSDILPLGPWVGIYAATTRQGMSGAVFGAEEKISRFEALRAYTAKGAFLTREEDIKGQLLPGMLADFIILEQNPLTVPDPALLNMQTNAVFLGGQQVWSNKP
ncbi:MAG: amidohydrolase [Pseudomonadales bacterium]|jgi:predicted amidohydrolase YtcJ|nr:amidohydrolase [Pseudomonadales bacterium]